MKWTEFLNTISTFDADSACFVAEVDSAGEIIGRVSVGDSRGDGMSPMMLKQVFNILLDEVPLGVGGYPDWDQHYPKENKMITTTGRTLMWHQL